MSLLAMRLEARAGAELDDAYPQQTVSFQVFSIPTRIQAKAIVASNRMVDCWTVSMLASTYSKVGVQ